MGRAVSISYIGPSVSPYTNLNPGYRIYYVDGDHDHTTRVSFNFKNKNNYGDFQLVVDHETWVMNLKEANLYDYPIWYKMYSARKAYDMTSLLPQDWDDLLQRLTSDSELFDLYYK